MKIILFVFLLSFNVFAENKSCEVATIAYEGALEVYVVGEAVISLGWKAYEVCKEDLVEEQQVIVENLKNACLDSTDKSDEQIVDCSFRAVEYFLYSQEV